MLILEEDYCKETPKNNLRKLSGYAGVALAPF
jgi:hypothetical protein